MGGENESIRIFRLCSVKLLVKGYRRSEDYNFRVNMFSLMWIWEMWVDMLGYFGV